jgi:hypothetical protein
MMHGLTNLKTVQHDTVLNTIGSCNTMVSTCVSKHRKGTVKMQYKKNGTPALGTYHEWSLQAWKLHWVSHFFLF